MGVNGRQWEHMVFYAFSMDKFFAKDAQKHQFT
jgi:hypothetical protein